jgi:hypothetical protein
MPDCQYWYGFTILQYSVFFFWYGVVGVRHTLQREVSTSSTWDGGSVEPLDHSQNSDGRVTDYTVTVIRLLSHLDSCCQYY